MTGHWDPWPSAPPGRSARRAAAHVIAEGRGVWVSLYEAEAQAPVSLVGAGIGLAHPPVARVPLQRHATAGAGPRDEEEGAGGGAGGLGNAGGATAGAPGDEERPLTIAEANNKILVEA